MRRRRREPKPGFWSKKTMVSIFIVAVMILSTAGFIFTQSPTQSSTVSYNGHDFFIRGDKWITEIDGSEAGFYYQPASVDRINVSEDALNMLRTAPMLYFTFNESEQYVEDLALIQYEFTDMMGKRFDTYVQSAFVHENDYGLPVIGCGNATTYVPVLYYLEGNESSIELQGGCILVTGRSQNDFYSLNDRILYGIFQVI